MPQWHPQQGRTRETRLEKHDKSCPLLEFTSSCKPQAAAGRVLGWPLLQLQTDLPFAIARGHGNGGIQDQEQLQWQLLQQGDMRGSTHTPLTPMLLAVLLTLPPTAAVALTMAAGFSSQLPEPPQELDLWQPTQHCGQSPPQAKWA